jgi:hypothetical protein
LGRQVHQRRFTRKAFNEHSPIQASRKRRTITAEHDNSDRLWEVVAKCRKCRPRCWSLGVVAVRSIERDAQYRPFDGGDDASR